jgi:putative ABC transport system substrate-binding protein
MRQFWICDLGSWIAEKTLRKTIRIRYGLSRSQNSVSTIQNLKWAGFLVAFLLGWGGTAEAQEAVKVWKIAVLASGSPASNKARDEALRQGLRELGYEEGKNIVIECTYAEGNLENLPELARQLVEQKPDVIVGGGTRVAVAAKRATSSIPIVVAGAGDLVEAGLIKSFMYPGGNVTGVARMSPDFFGARLKLVRETLPKAGHVAALTNPRNPGHARALKDAELGAKSLGLVFQAVPARGVNELDGAIAAAAKGGADALFIMTDAFFNSHAAQIARASTKSRIAAISDRSDFVEAGGLMSYGVNLPDLSRRAAQYVDQILKGAKPAELTLVQPTKFDLAVNIKTARQIGVVIPPEVIARAAKVIK